MTNDSEQAQTPVTANSSPQTDRDLIGDSLKLSDANRQGVNNFIQSNTGQQNNLLKDLLNISLPLLVAALTLLALPDSNTAHSIIKTRGLFTGSMMIVVTEVVLNLLIRLRAIGFTRDITYLLENHHIDLTGAAKVYMSEPTIQNAQKLIDAEKNIPVLPKPGWLLLHGYKVTVALFLIGFLGLGVSIIFHIST